MNLNLVRFIKDGPNFSLNKCCYLSQANAQGFFVINIYVQSNENKTVFLRIRMTSLLLVYLLTLPISIFGLENRRLEHNGITVKFNTEECELEILYLDIQFICHSKDRPAFFIGRGDFDAVYYTGNYEINDTITEWV